MRAVVYDEYGGPLEVRDVAEPACPPGGVVIEVGATGVCRSDWHAWRGHDPVALPHVPGHELAGTVAAVGAGVSGWRTGDRVTVPFACGCGRCPYCLAGDAQVCPDQTQPGFTGPGSFAERVAIDAADANLIGLPDEVDFVTAASLGCRFATAFRAVVTHGRPRRGDPPGVVGSDPLNGTAADRPGGATGDTRGGTAGDWVAVHGCGGVGLSAVMIASALGARVVAVDVADGALALARELGASVTVSGGAGADVAGAVVEATGGGAHVSLDALGSAVTAVNSVRCLRRRGRHVQVGLLLGQAATPPIPMDEVIARELEIYGSHGMSARDYPAMMSLIADGTLSPGRLIGQVITLDEAGPALAAMDGTPATAGITVINLRL